MEFPDKLEDFGYNFNEDGQLRSISTEKPYQFHFKEDNPSYNQKRYEALGEVITYEIYTLLEVVCGLERFPVPMNSSREEPSTFIFCSDNYRTADKLLILIHGSGVVRAGQWARRLIINDCLDSGTQIPFIKKGLDEGYGIIVMNTNDNTAVIDGTERIIEQSDTPEVHALYVWINYVRKCEASHVAIVAHSYGGVVLTKLADKFADEFSQRVFAVALTDSVHYRIPKNSNLKEVGCNWIGSRKPLDTPISRNFDDINCVSAGCIEHEMTSWSSFNSIFKFFSDRLAHSSESPEFKSQSSSKKKKVETFSDEENFASNSRDNSPLNCGAFKRKSHYVSPDRDVGIETCSKEGMEDDDNDRNEILEAMSPEDQPLECTTNPLSEPSNLTENSDIVAPKIEEELKLDDNINLGTDSVDQSTTSTVEDSLGDGAIESNALMKDLSNSQEVEKVSESSSIEVNVATCPGTAPDAELQDNAMENKSAMEDLSKFLEVEKVSVPSSIEVNVATFSGTSPGADLPDDAMENDAVMEDLSKSQEVGKVSDSSSIEVNASYCAGTTSEGELPKQKGCEADSNIA